MTEPDFAALLTFRTQLRRFLHWSEQQALAEGITPAQHQLILGVGGHPDPRGPTVGELAEYLVLRHHSVVGLIDRAEGAGLVVRAPDDTDHRVVRVRLTPEGRRRLNRLARLHLQELRRLGVRVGAEDTPWALDLPVK